MKVLLTVPIQSLAHAPELVDTGLGYVAAACRQAGADVTLVDWNARHTPADFAALVRDLAPDLVGVKAFTVNFRAVVRTLQIVRQEAPEALTLIGGPHPSTSRAEDVGREFGSLLDFAMAGEGEAGMSHLVEAFGRHGPRMPEQVLADVPGLIRPTDDGWAANPPHCADDIDALPSPDWSVQNPLEYRSGIPGDPATFGRTAPLATSRGCPGRCGYCMAWRINGPTGRQRRLECVQAEIARLADEFGVRRLMFTDNAFLAEPDRVKALSRWLAERRPKLVWDFVPASFFGHLEDPELLTLMREGGCEAAVFGIESGSAPVLERLRKHPRPDDYARAVRATLDAGIRAIGFFMFGFPDETIEEMQETLDFATRVPFTRVHFGICLPLPGTTSYKAVLEQHGLDRIDWSSFDFDRPGLLPSQASPREVRRMLHNANMRTRRGPGKLKYWVRSRLLGRA